MFRFEFDDPTHFRMYYTPIVTTIKPNVGSMIYDDLRSISLADLPGLIEGAHKNVGMGHQFLRHCERTKLLLLVVDIQGFQLSMEKVYRTCLETVFLLNKVTWRKKYSPFISVSDLIIFIPGEVILECTNNKILFLSDYFP